MSPSPRRQTALAALPTPRTSRIALAAFALAAFVPVSVASAAPLRSISIGPQGTWFVGFVPKAIANDGRTVVGAFEPQPEYAGDPLSVPDVDGLPSSTPIIRDLVAQKTSALPGLAPIDQIMAASSDLSTLVIGTSQSYSPADTNGTDYDYYLYDSRTGAKTLLTRAPDGTALGWHQIDTPDKDPQILRDPSLSGDGKVAEFSVGRLKSTGSGYDWQLWQLDVSTGALTKIADERNGAGPALDDAGRIALTTQQIVIDGKHYQLPSGANPQGAVVSPGGNFAAEQDDSHVYTLDTRNGAVNTITVPSWVVSSPARWVLSNVSDDGSAIIHSWFDTAKFPKFQVGKIDPRGNVSQLGSDMPLTREFAMFIGTVSRNGLFAFDPLHVQALGSVPVPGTEPPAPTSFPEASYVQLTDLTCTSFFGFRMPAKPRLTLSDEAHGYDLRVASKAVVTVKRTSSGQVTNQFTLTPNQTKNLSTGVNGDFTISSTVSFTNGTVSTGTQVVPSHSAPTCGGLR